mgnify:CR=1 FL=1
MIAAAKKPFIFVGGGAVIADASEEVRALAHKIQAPVCDSLMGKGLFPERMSFTQVRLECMEPKLPTTQCASVTF